MRKIIVGFGLAIGTLFCAMLFLMLYIIYNKPEVKSNDVIGYATMVVIFSLIYFGVRTIRNKQLNGAISFWNALKQGFLIALVGSTMYVVVWLFFYYLFVPDFMDQFTARVLSEVPESQLEAKSAEMAAFKEYYKNPLFVILITYFEILPIGVIVAFFSALLLKKKKH